MSGAPESFRWSSPEGHRLAHTILQPSLPFDPHDYQLEGVCKLLDGYDLLAVIPTGAGKTGYFVIYILLLLALADDPALCSPPRTGVPQDPGMLIAYPTIGLEEEMAIVFEKFKLRTLVINSDTLQAARREGRDLWAAAVAGYSMILLSPELLSSPSFEYLLQHPRFQARMCALGIDEVHLLNSWGTGFRKSFLQLGYMRARMRDTVRLIGLSASILAGQPFKNVCEFLGLRWGQFYFLQRSNICPELQLLFRPLSHGLGRWKFPDFRWILEGRWKTVVFCRTIAISFRLACYLQQFSTSSDSPIRLYNSLNWPCYNARTRKLMRSDPTVFIIIATASFMVGVDLPNIQDVVLIQEPEDADEWVQWGGRAGRDPSVVSDARVITYITKKGPKTAQAILNAATSGSSAVPSANVKKTSAPTMDVSTARLIITKCKIEAQNELYENPTCDEVCLCGLYMGRSASRSGANFEEIYDSLGDSPASRALPPTVYLPQPLISSILDKYALLSSPNDLRQLLEGRTFTLPHLKSLWDMLRALRPEFEDIRIKAAEERKRKAAEKAAERAKVARAVVGMSAEELEAAMQAALEELSKDSDDDLEFIWAPRLDIGEPSSGEAPSNNLAGSPSGMASTISSVPKDSPRPSLVPSTAVNMPAAGHSSAQAAVHAVEVEQGEGYAMHILSFGKEANHPSQARRKRPTREDHKQSGQPPSKRVRLSDKENMP